MIRNSKFNPKQFRGKQRIYVAVKGYPRISRLYVWDETKSQYDIPPKGKSYLAKRYEFDSNGIRKRTCEFFESLQDALDWQADRKPKTPNTTTHPVEVGPYFGEIVADWRIRKLSQKAKTTQVAYEKMLRLYFTELMNVPMRAFNAKVVDAWLSELKRPDGKYMQSKRRIAFDHELDLLSGILRFYREYHDEEFRHPIFHRHREDVLTGREHAKPEKDIRYADFQKFLHELMKEKHARVFAALATVQYFQALRISEAAAIHWEDVFLHPDEPEASRLYIRRSVIWPRVRGSTSYIKLGFKNSKANDGYKEQPLFPESYFAFRRLPEARKKGLVFHLDGMHLEYRQIEYAYNKAFQRAGLPYRGTHVMRHGGTRLVYNETKDIEVAKQLLGNTDLQTVTVYAQRDATALTQFAKERWKTSKYLVANGCSR